LPEFDIGSASKLFYILSSINQQRRTTSLRSLARLFHHYGSTPAGVLYTFGKFGQFGTEIKCLTLDLQRNLMTN
jgi:hypothetical protein